MKSREERIQALLLNEIASKSVPAAITFAIFALLIFFYQFHVVALRVPLQIACSAVIIASSMRIYISRHYSSEEDQNLYWRLVRISVWINTLAWTVIFGSAAWELKATGYHFVAAMILMTGFASASLVTLSYDKWIFFPFNIFMIGVPTAIATWFGFTTGIAAYYSITTAFFFFFLYQYKQYREYRSVLEHRFNTQVDLQDSNEALKESQQTLISQTVQLVQASKASALGEMAGGLSHEVNNSLMVILGTVQQLERKLNQEKLSDPEYGKKVQRMTEAIQKIKTVVDGLKYFSLERESVPMEKVGLSEIIERTMNYCQEMLKAHEIQLTVESVPFVRIHCHPMELTQVMFSILKNADEAVSKSLNQNERWIKIKFKETPGRVKIIITNGGPKIEDHVREKVFQPFFTTKEVGEGTGLSLSIGKGIMKEHGGDLSIDEDETSTCFVMELPSTQV